MPASIADRFKAAQALGVQPRDFVTVYGGSDGSDAKWWQETGNVVLRVHPGIEEPFVAGIVNLEVEDMRRLPIDLESDWSYCVDLLSNYGYQSAVLDIMEAIAVRTRRGAYFHVDTDPVRDCEWWRSRLVGYFDWVKTTEEQPDWACFITGPGVRYGSVRTGA